MKEVFKKRWYVILYFMAVTAVIGAMVFHRDETNTRFEVRDGLSFEREWEYEFADGAKGTTELPNYLPSNTSGRLTLKNTLPEFDAPMSLFYRVRHTTLRVYIDGELRLDTKTGHKVFGKCEHIIGIYNQEIPLVPSDAGKEVILEITCSSNLYIDQPGSVYLGDRGSFILEMLRLYGSALIWTLFLVFLAVLLFMLWGATTFIMHQRTREILCLALFSLSVACWLFAQSNFSQFIVNDMGVISLMSYESLMLMPVPIALFFVYYSDRERGRRYSAIASIIPLVLFVINNALHVLGIVPIADSMICSQLMLIGETVFIATIQVSEIHYKYTHKEEYPALVWVIPLVGIAALLPMALLEILRCMIYNSGFANDGTFVSLGILFYMAALAFDTVVRINCRTEKLKENSEVKTQFLANMSHEIRTPINAILGFDEVILRVSKDERILKYAQNIQEAGENLKSIINSILDISKIESGKLELYSVEYNTVSMLDRVISMTEALAKKKGLHVIADIDERLPQNLIGDENHIMQVVNNLMNNAVKYTEKGTITLSVKVVEFAEDMPICRLRFSVKDTGYGIKPEDREKLFMKFERLDREKNYSTEGTGLGMSIVVQLLRAMGSEIKVDSVYGEGSEFYFELTQNVIRREGIGSFEDKRKQLALENSQTIDFVAPNARILIVDDVQMNLDAASALLEQFEMQIDTASSGKEAYQKVQENKYNLVLMDHMMPEWDGIETSEKIRELAVAKEDPYYAELPIIALTANAMVGMKEKFFQVGMQDFVSKPIEVNVLNNAVKKWLPKEVIEYISVEERAKKNLHVTVNAQQEWKKGIPECVDLETAKNYCPSYELFERNLKSFYGNYEATRTKLHEFAEQKDDKNYTITVHGLKSTSKMIGLLELSDMALEQEKLCQTGHAQEVWSNKMEALLALYEACSQEIMAYLGVEPMEEASVAAMPLEAYEELLGRIKEAADDFDMGAFMLLEDELAEVHPPEGRVEQFAKVKELVANTAFGDLSEYLEE